MRENSDLLHYFKECYRNDNRQSCITNIFERKVELLFSNNESEKIINHHYEHYLLTDAIAEKYTQQLELYKKEKELWYGSIFLLGESFSFNKKHTFCMPLFLGRAALDYIDDRIFAQVNLLTLQFNSNGLLELFNFSKEIKVLVEKIEKMLIDEKISPSILLRIITECEHVIPNLDSSLCDAFPKTIKLSDIKKIGKTKLPDIYKLVSGSCTFVMKKSQSTRGVMNELTELRDAELSESLTMLLQGKNGNNNFEHSIEYLPFDLNESQIRAIEIANNYRLSIVNGPPGTGKSYTITAVIIDALLSGKTVLMSSKNSEAIDVVYEKIMAVIGDNHIVVRAGRKEALRELKRYLRNLLTKGIVLEENCKGRIDQTKRALTKIQEKIIKIKKKITYEQSRAVRRGKRLVRISQDQGVFLDQFFYFFYKREPLKTNVQSYYNDLETIIEERNDVALELLKLYANYRIYTLLENDRSELQKLDNALRARTDTKAETVFKSIDFQKILSAFPIWLCDLTSLYDILPLKKELFNIAIIDEATQCDITTSLPLFHRAQNVIIFGDENQLRHFSFLSYSKQLTLFKESCKNSQDFRYEVHNYRDLSILDLVNNSLTSQKHTCLLDEHFRSTPENIAFNNEEFYNGNLKLMQATRSLLEKCIYLFFVDGKQDTRGVNHEEAAVILKSIDTIAREEQLLGSTQKTTIGVITPFQKQSEYLENFLYDNLLTEIFDDHKLKIGTPYSFQGGERDVVFISFTVSNDSHGGTIRYLERPDMFNVLTSRCRNRHVIVHSIKDVTALPAQSLLRRYLKFVKKSLDKIESQKVDDLFINEIIGELPEEIEAFPNYKLAGINIDILLKKEERFIGIDTIGFPGKFEQFFSLPRYRVMGRTGTKLLPVFYQDWLIDKQAVLRSILDEFTE